MPPRERESMDALADEADAHITTMPVMAVKPASPRPQTEDKKPSKKRLRWSTITVYEFGVGLGGSSVPSKGGPSIGLADEPEFTWTTNVGEMAERSEGIHRFTSDERVRMLQSIGISDGMILRYSRETNIILSSRKRTHMEDQAEKRAKKQIVETKAALDRPCSAFVGRPRMIPANYV